MKQGTASVQKSRLETLTQYLTSEVKAFFATLQDAAPIPMDLLKKLAGFGLFGLYQPQRWGGLNLTEKQVGEIIAQVASISPSLASLVTVHTMTTNMIARWGSDWQQTHYLPKLCSGQLFAGFALTEPNCGSDMSAIETTVSFEDDTLLLNGQKAWISGGHAFDVFMVFAQSTRGAVAVLVERQFIGFTSTPIVSFVGFSNSMMANLAFNNMRLPATALLSNPGFGLSLIANNSLDIGRYLIAWTAVGIMAACLSMAKSQANSRHLFSDKLSQFQMTRLNVTKSLAAYHSAMALCHESASSRESGTPDCVFKTNLAKYHASNAAFEVVSNTIQLHGAKGLSQALPLAKLLADAKVTQIIEGSSEIQAQLIAEAYLAT